MNSIILLERGTQEIEDFITYENAELEETEEGQGRLVIKRDNKVGFSYRNEPNVL